MVKVAAPRVKKVQSSNRREYLYRAPGGARKSPRLRNIRSNIAKKKQTDSGVPDFVFRVPSGYRKSARLQEKRENMTDNFFNAGDVPDFKTNKSDDEKSNKNV